ncbi:MAG: T9SS type A sorting domain-containing protein [Bacteroidales bacterium]|nr:T9SS type A sorting domain-containing protein [Bacteroidales bacterium]
MKRLILILVISCFSLYGIKAQCPLTEAVDFTATDVHGHTWNLFELLDSGQYVCIDFFFCSCGPCQIAAPKINESYVYFGCNSGDVNYFAIDTGDDDAACILFDETFGVEYPTISGVEGGGTQICNDYQIPLYPTVILIAPDRTILEQDIWPIPTAQTMIDALEAHGLEEHDCPPPIGIEDPIASLASISSVYPNPASNIARIVISSEEAMSATVEVYNALGIKVLEIQQINLVPGENTIEFSIADLPTGTYFIRVLKDNEILDVSRLSVVN